jgi:hypothetical protein
VAISAELRFVALECRALLHAFLRPIYMGEPGNLGLGSLPARKALGVPGKPWIYRALFAFVICRQTVQEFWRNGLGSPREVGVCRCHCLRSDLISLFEWVRLVGKTIVQLSFHQYSPRAAASFRHIRRWDHTRSRLLACR